MEGTVGERLRRERRRLNLTQEALAEALGATPRSVRRWERDEVLPQPHYRARCCQVFGVGSESLFGADTVEPSTPLAPDVTAAGGRRAAWAIAPALAAVLLVVAIAIQRDTGAVQGLARTAGAVTTTTDAVPAGAGPRVIGPGCPQGRDRGVTETSYRGGWVRVAAGGWRGDGCDGSFRDTWDSGSDGSYVNTLTWWSRTAGVGAVACAVRVYVPWGTRMVQTGGNHVVYEVLTGADHHLAGTFVLDQRDHRGEWLDAGTFTAADGYLAVRVTDTGQGSHYVAASAVSVRCDAL